MAGLLQSLLAPLEDLLYRYSEQRHPDNVGYDDTHGTETSRFDWFGNYEPTRASVVEAVLGALHLDWPRWTFVDLGAGKGRVVLMAAARPFRRCVGIEVSAAHIARARANEALVETACPVVWLHADVADQPLPQGPLVLFLYNPFGADVLRTVLARVGDRDARIAYVNPELAEQVELAGFVETARGRDGKLQHWRVYGRPA